MMKGMGKQLGKPARLAVFALIALSVGMVGFLGSGVLGKKTESTEAKEPDAWDFEPTQFCKKSALGKHLPELKEGTISFTLDGNDFISDRPDCDLEYTFGPDKAHRLVLKKRRACGSGKHARGNVRYTC
jgi:hypothetical protein